MILGIAQLGKPVLREKSKDVELLKNRKIQQLIDNMIATVQEADGVGIAAPQVFVPLRIFIVASRPNPRYPNAPFMEPFPIINPVIIAKSEKKEKDWEGCLSIPGIRGNVPRHTEITLRYLLRDAKEEEKEYTGFVARIFQHEFDHINGKVFLDVLESTNDIITDKEYMKIILKSSQFQSQNSPKTSE